MPWVEWGLAALIVAGIARAIGQFLSRGNFPHPLQSNSAEALMDLYNTAYWANSPGAYDVWHTVYPPLSFVFLRLFTDPRCYMADAHAGRACDPMAAWVMLGFYGLNLGLVFFSLRKAQPRVALPRTIALCGGASMLYGLELGNLILPCFSAFVLAEGGLLRSAWLRQLFRVIAINFKPYLLLLVLPQIVRRRWGWLLALIAMGLGVYAITAVLEGDGAPWVILRNFYLYSLTLPDKYGANNHLAEIAARSGGVWNLVFPALIRLAEVGILVCLALVAFRPNTVSPRLLTIMVLSILSAEAALHTQGYSADYTMIFFLFLLFLEPWSGRLGVLLLIGAYLLCIPADYVISPVVSKETAGYLAGGPVRAEYDLMAGQFIRPAILIIIQCGMAASCMLNLWRSRPHKPASTL